MLAALFGIGSAHVGAVEPTAGAVAKVEAFHGVLIEVMQIEDQALREAHLQEVIADVFDIERIAAISVGRIWSTLDAAPREEFVGLLQSLIVSTYADRFDGFAGQRFETREHTSVRAGDVVKTYLVRADESRVTLDYFLRGGKVFNVVADGVSDLSLRRADYSSIVKSEGFAALTEHVRDKIVIARQAD